LNIQDIIPKRIISHGDFQFEKLEREATMCTKYLFHEKRPRGSTIDFTSCLNSSSQKTSTNSNSNISNNSQNETDLKLPKKHLISQIKVTNIANSLYYTNTKTIFRINSKEEDEQKKVKQLITDLLTKIFVSEPLHNSQKLQFEYIFMKKVGRSFFANAIYQEKFNNVKKLNYLLIW